MSLKFNIDRPKVSEEEIKKNQDFQKLVKKFKEQSIKQAKGDESWWKNKMVRYSTVIAGVTVVCTITYFSLFNSQKDNKKHDSIATSSNQNTKPKPDTDNKSTPYIKAPSAKLKQPASTYRVNNAKGGTINHHSKTKIVVPKNSFVDKEGKAIVGDVTIEYLEFHDQAEVIANGMPMAYDSAGHKFQFETAGMFQINGTQNGEQVYIAPQKTLEVQLASKNPESKFNQYVLDTVARNWKYIQKDQALTHSVPVSDAPNKKLETLKREIEVIIPAKVDSVSFVYDRKKNALSTPKKPLAPNAPTKGRPSFRLDGSYSEFPELSVFDNVVFEVGPENKNYSKELHSITWSDVKVSPGPVKGVNYLLTLTYRQRVEKLIVYPVLSGNDLEKAKSDYDRKLQDYDQKLASRQKEEQRLSQELEKKQSAYLAEQKKKKEEYDREKARIREQMAENAKNVAAINASANNQVKATRIFRISEFGIFNSDCPHEVPKGTKTSPVFLAGSEGKPLMPSAVYLIDHSNKTVFDVARDNGYRFVYDQDIEYSICVFVNDKVYICSKEQFKNTSENSSNKFKVSELKEGAGDIGEFRKAIEI